MPHCGREPAEPKDAIKESFTLPLQDSCLASLERWGWTPELSQHLQTVHLQGDASAGTVLPARVVSLAREIYRVQTPDGERTARPSGTLRSGAELPAIGDWVLSDPLPPGHTESETIIRSVLPRRTRLSRKVAGSRTEEQIVAANVDVVFLVMGLDGDFNLRRRERLAVMAWESGADPVVILTKSDLPDDAMELRFQAQDAAPGVPVHLTSSLRSEGLEPLRAYLGEARTVALVGSSGAGKSTLLNALCGEEVMSTGAVREGDDRGRHTTTHRQLVRLPGGGLLIDNPGVREIQLWSGDEALGEAFEDVESLAATCRFRDCRHEDEPGCAVLQAVEDRRLAEERLESYRGLQRELRHLELKQDVAARREENRRTSKLYRSIQTAKRRRKGMA